MNHSLYIISTFIHVIAAAFWIGSMLFLSLVMIPSLRAEESPGLAGRMIRLVGPRYKLLGWLSLATLAVTGLLNLASRGISHTMLADPVFWQSPYGQSLAWKLILFAIVILLSALHDGVVGPRFRAASRNGAPVERYRILASWLGRLILLLSLGILFFAVTLVRGTPW